MSGRSTNVVDVTNYVMLELGHPMHAFDLAKLGGRAIRIRRAAPGETVRTLDAQTRTLADDMLVIADADRPQAIAGVMGGADSEVGAGTRTIILESAYFKPTSVRSTSKRVGLSTDASYRFERGADIEAPVVALRRALALLAQIGAAEAVGPIVDRYPTPRTPATLELRHERITQILGQDIDEGFVPRTLGRLEFDVETLPPVRAGARWRVTVPSHRVDVSREIDLVEEVARHHGYDRLPSTFPALVRAPAPIPRWLRRNRLLNRVLTAAGCWEAITYSFIERSAAEPFVAAPDDIVPIANPLSEKFTVLRPSLLPGLLDSLVWNRRRQHRDIRLFELGNRFRAREGETTAIALVATGAGLAPHWSSGEREVDLFDVKGIVERVCDALGVAAEVEAADYPELVAGRSAVLRALHGDTTLGRLGQIQPAIAAGARAPQRGRGGLCRRARHRRPRTDRVRPRCDAGDAVAAISVDRARHLDSGRRRLACACGSWHDPGGRGRDLDRCACLRPVRGQGRARGPGQPRASLDVSRRRPDADRHRGAGNNDVRRRRAR